MKKITTPVVIVGSGISGLYAALKIEQQLNLSDEILLITKSKITDCNSYYAQGGMVAVLEENKSDSVELHTSDTLYAAAGLGEENVIKFISENSDTVVKDLLNFGVNFDRDEKGKLALTKEAAHSVNRILHAGGDATGRQMEIALIDAVKKNERIKIFENTMLVDILKDNDGNCAGIIAYNGEYYEINSSAVILATGGLGQIYKYTTNPVVATGDGIAAAYRAGAVLRDMEFVQFHPTALSFDDHINKNRFLISEALRGEGAKLCDKFGYEFMKDYHEKLELAPRDIVARANFLQMEKANASNVYLNATTIDKTKLLKRFPTIAKKCGEYGIDITKDFIPVAPVAHYFMGGIKTDKYGKTSINGLFAIGECASTGLHGANRLASNSLLECVVMAYEVANYLKTLNLPVQNYGKYIEDNNERNNVNFSDLATMKEKLKSTMWKNAGIFRNETSLNLALSDIKDLEKNFNQCQKCVTKEEYEFRNMLLCAKLIVVCALKRKESRGAHYRTDFLPDKKIAKHSLVKKNGEEDIVE